MIKLLFCIIFISSLCFAGYWNFIKNGVWSPTSEGASCGFWLDPTNNTKITKDGSNNVSNWQDSCSSSNFAQASGGLQPIVTASAINGLQAMAFTATKGLTGPANKYVSTGAAWTIALSGQVTYPATSVSTFIEFSDGGGSDPCYQISFSKNIVGNTGYIGLDTGQSNSAYAQLLYNATIANNTVFKLVITYSGSSPTSTGSYEIWYNGTSQTVTTNLGGWNAGTTLTGTVIGALGGYSTYGNASYTGDVMFFSKKDSTLTSNINTYLSRWGV